VFVFKNIVILDSALKFATDTYMWVNGVIECFFLTPGSASQLKAGEVVDVVGIDVGVCKDYTGTLMFNNCVFLPAGSVQLPAPGSGGASIPGY